MLVDRPGLGAWVASLGIVVAYVGSLYVWPARHRAPRDAPGVIKRRFLSLAGACALASPSTARSSPRKSPRARLPSRARSGSTPTPSPRSPPSPPPSDSPPRSSSGRSSPSPSTDASSSRFADALRLDRLVKWRNYVVAPATEEFAFRACVAPSSLVTGAATLRGAVFASPLLFGLAHIHHFAELRRRSGSASAAALGVAAQFTYTVVFGWFAAFAFLRTGHLAGPVAAHAFCNVMGLPDARRDAPESAGRSRGVRLRYRGVPRGVMASHRSGDASRVDVERLAAASEVAVAKRNRTAR